MVFYGNFWDAWCAARGALSLKRQTKRSIGKNATATSCLRRVAPKVKIVRLSVRGALWHVGRSAAWVWRRLARTWRGSAFSIFHWPEVLDSENLFLGFLSLVSHSC